MFDLRSALTPAFALAAVCFSAGANAGVVDDPAATAAAGSAGSGVGGVVQQTAPQQRDATSTAQDAAAAPVAAVAAADPAVDSTVADASGPAPVEAEAATPVPVVPAASSALQPEPSPQLDLRPADLHAAEGLALSNEDPVAAAAAVASAPKKAPPAGVSFSGIPAVNYIADNGLGLGAIVAAYFNDGESAPYRTAITLQLFISTKLVQDHNVIVDSLRLFDLPLRLNARVGYLSSLTQNYCGVGGSVTCDPAVAAAAASDAGLVDDKSNVNDSYDQFVGHYYQRRFMSPYGLLNLRYALIERTPGQQMRVEVTGGYRAFYFIPGNVFADEANNLTPYAGSLFANDHPDGEGGLSSVVQAGLMLDSRDNEPAPTEGWWIEGSARTTTPGLSTWNYGGFNVTVRGYTHLPVANLDRRLVLANRFTIDGLVGDVPIQEMARLGGSQDVYAFGGADTGRGIRVQRYLGKAKVINMSELRFRFFEFGFFEQSFALTAAAFVDAALIGDELIQPKDLGVVGSGGGALRIAWNENFIVRLDVGASPSENWAPQFYLTINQPF